MKRKLEETVELCGLKVAGSLGFVVQEIVHVVESSRQWRYMFRWRYWFEGGRGFSGGRGFIGW